ncbi:hypothetical protein QFZ22_000191 [Streptomyces canus]|uniref:Uncharacterized protein n=1 Tax=Streptomyces canus TaxID=58343 RepID=A0AAW8F2C6_9ACTN|nr:hypothetical protein [Streptomyces canus]
MYERHDDGTDPHRNAQLRVAEGRVDRERPEGNRRNSLTRRYVASVELASRAGVPTCPSLSVGADVNALSTDEARRTDCVSSPGAAHFIGSPT